MDLHSDISKTKRKGIIGIKVLLNNSCDIRIEFFRIFNSGSSQDRVQDTRRGGSIYMHFLDKISHGWL